jgi:hypothetical protein
MNRPSTRRNFDERRPSEKDTPPLPAVQAFDSLVEALLNVPHDPGFEGFDLDVVVRVQVDVVLGRR